MSPILPSRLKECGVFLIGTVVSLAATGCTAVRLPATWEFDGVSFPPGVEGFAAVNVRRWIEHPWLGVAVTYLLPEERSAELTLYVYPVDESQREGATSGQDALAREYEAALRDLREYAQGSREVDELEVEEERDWEAPLADGSTLIGRSARLSLRWDQFRVRSYLVVFVRDGTYIKFRLSYDIEANDEVLPRFERAVPKLLAAVERRTE